MATAPVRRLDANHDMTFGQGLSNFATLSEATEQRVRTRLLLILGEWFLDTTAGVPWFATPDGTATPFMGTTADLGYIDATLKAVILATDGVDSINTFDMNFDHSTRKLSITVNGNTVDGGIFNVKIQNPGP